MNADNIGKRIRLLRKQKNVSQEKMALDLGLYQADISNLERAMTGSGISDLFRLEMIAEYFNISLIELLVGVEPESDGSASEKENPEGYMMRDYIITDVKYGTDGFDAFASEMRMTAPDSSVTYVSFSELNGVPRFFKTTVGIFDELMAAKSEIPKELLESCFLSGDDYVDIFEHVDPEWLDICRYLIILATENDGSQEMVDKLIQDTKGKAIKDIQVPIPEREPEQLFNVDFSDLSAVYRYRLMLEASISTISI